MNIPSATTDAVTCGASIYRVIKPDECFNGNRRKMHFRLEINWRHVIYGTGFCYIPADHLMTGLVLNYERVRFSLIFLFRGMRPDI